MARSRAQLALSTRLMNVGIAALCRGGSLDRAKSVLVDAIRLSPPPTWSPTTPSSPRTAGSPASTRVSPSCTEYGRPG